MWRPAGGLDALPGEEFTGRYHLFRVNSAGIRCPDDNTLAELCDGSMPSERRALLGEHIDGCEDCREAVAALVGGRTPATPAIPAGQLVVEGSRELVAGTMVGRYRIERRVGAGGMGVVYAAVDAELERKVALKFLRPELEKHGGDALEQRLLRECRAMAKLAHPNVITLYDIDRLDGRLYMAMELIDGQSLRGWLGEKRGWTEILGTFVAAGNGLAAAHRAGIVHRDFKPDNVLIANDGRVLVMDFGVAASGVMDSESGVGVGKGRGTEEVGLTVTGMAVGTPAYMPPEQYRGDPVDARSDVFSFCVSLFQALHGRRPFAGARSSEIQDAIAAGAIAAPPDGSEVPGWLHRAVVRGLAADPAQRWPSMDALLAVLAPRRRRRRRTVAAAAAIVVLAAGGAAAWAWTAGEAQGKQKQQQVHELELQGNGCPDPRERLGAAWDLDTELRVQTAVLAAGGPPAIARWRRVDAALDRWSDRWTAMHAQVCAAGRSGEVSRELTDLRMECLDARRREAAALTELLAESPPDGLDGAAEAVEGLPAVDGCATAAVLGVRMHWPEDQETRREVAELRNAIARADALRLAGDPRSGALLLEPLVALAAGLHWKPIEAELQYTLGAIQATGNPKIALATVRRAAVTAEASRHELVAAEAWILLISIAAEDLGDLERAAEYADSAQAAIERLGGDRELESRYRYHLGILRWRQGKHAEAEAEFAKALALARAIGSSAQEIGALSGLGLVYEDRGEFKRALEIHQKVIAARAAEFGPVHPDLALDHANLASAYMELGDQAAALEHATQALAIGEQALGAGHPELGTHVFNLGEMQRVAGNGEQALALFRRAEQIYADGLGPRHARVAMTLEHQGGALIGLDRAAEAVPLIERALGIYRDTVGEHHADHGKCLVNLADAETRAGKLDAALDHARSGRDTLRAALGPDHAHVGFAGVQLGTTLLAAGRARDAIAELEAAIAIYERSDWDPAMTTAARATLEQARRVSAGGRVATRRGASSR